MAVLLSALSSGRVDVLVADESVKKACEALKLDHSLLSLLAAVLSCDAAALSRLETPLRVPDEALLLLAVCGQSQAAFTQQLPTLRRCLGSSSLSDAAATVLWSLAHRDHTALKAQLKADKVLAPFAGLISDVVAFTSLAASSSDPDRLRPGPVSRGREKLIERLAQALKCSEHRVRFIADICLGGDVGSVAGERWRDDSDAGVHQINLTIADAKQAEKACLEAARRLLGYDVELIPARPPVVEAKKESKRGGPAAAPAAAPAAPAPAAASADVVVEMAAPRDPRQLLTLKHMGLKTDDGRPILEYALSARAQIDGTPPACGHCRVGVLLSSVHARFSHSARVPAVYLLSGPHCVRVRCRLRRLPPRRPLAL
jgi:hypothetical protein